MRVSMIAGRQAPADTRDIAALLRNAWPQAECSGSGRIIVDGPMFKGDYSVIYRAEVPGVAGRLAVKCCIDPKRSEADRAAARVQFGALSRVHEAMSADPAYRVPHPYWLDEERGVLVIEWIAGRSMTDRLRSFRETPGDLLELMRRAGRWLRLFHDAHRLPPRPLDVSSKLDGLETIEQSPLHRRQSVRGAVAVLRRCADVATRGVAEQSWVHGDFKSDNLLFAAGETIGIDLHVRHENAVVYDLAAFVNHLDLTLRHPILLRWRPWRARMIAAFFHAYEPRHAIAKTPALRWAALYLLLDSWAESTARMDASLARRYLDACFDAAVGQNVADLHAVSVNPFA